MYIFYIKNKKFSKTEEELILLSKKNSKFFAPIYQKYHEKIFRFIYNRIDSIDDTADITSQVFVKALINIKNFEYRKISISSWLYRIAINEINQYYRNNKKVRLISINESDLEKIIEENSFFEKEKNNKEKYIDKIIKSINELSEEKVLLIEMRYFEKKSFKEIGQILNITENNAKVKVYRILNELKLKIK